MSLKLVNGVYHWRKTIEGHPFFKSTKTDDLRLAEQMAAIWEADAIREIVVKGARPVNLHSVIKSYLDARRGKGGHGSAATHLGHFLQLPNVKFSEITESQVLEVINKRREAGISHNTLAVTVSYWNALVNYAERQKWSTGTKIDRIEPVKTRIRYLSDQEEMDLLAAIDPNAKFPGRCARTIKARQDNTDLLICLLDTGARYSEIAGMKWTQVDLSNRRILVYRLKGGTDTTLVMTDRLWETLSRRWAGRTDEWVFPNKRKFNNCFKWLKPALERAGINADLGKVTIHTMRHTHATRLLHGGLNIVEVQGQLGHASLNSTMVYLHMIPNSAAEKAASILNK